MQPYPLPDLRKDDLDRLRPACRCGEGVRTRRPVVRGPRRVTRLLLAHLRSLTARTFVDMRTKGTNRALAVAFAALLLAGCEQLNDAANTWDKASLCVKALKAADFVPNLNDPAQTARDAATASQELSALADKAQDATLRDALTTMSDKVAGLNTSDLTAGQMQAFIDQKVDLYQSLSSACQ